MIRIDGSLGEGGGQILRTSLSLSLVTKQPFRIDNIRAGRPKPGLLRQHLTAVLAAAEVGGAKVEGATLGSTAVSFTPGSVKPGDYNFADRVEWPGLRPATLPHHRTCGFPHPAVELSGLLLPQDSMASQTP